MNWPFKRTAYTLAILMVFALPVILHFIYGITDFQNRFMLTSYMIMYGFLLSWSSQKGE